MKKIFLYYLSAIMLLASCEKGIESSSEGQLAIDIQIAGLETKAVESGKDELNENKVSELDLFMYKDGEDKAKVHKHIATDITGSGSVNVRLSNSELGSLGYTLGTECSFKIYVIANRSAELSFLGNESIAELGQKTITSSKPFNELQDNFVMTGEGIASGGSGSSGFTMTSPVQLKRVACKFGISITATTPYVGVIGDGGSGTWTPQPALATVKFYGSTPEGKISGEPQRMPTDDFETERSLEVAAVYYSYPGRPLPENKPYYIITLPWKKDASTVRNTYYKVICDYEIFQSNTFYSLKVDITKVGSDEEPKPIVVKPEALTFRTAEWVDGVLDSKEYNTEAVIKDARFLVIYSDEYVMDNINKIDIPYTSSHECDVTITSAEWTDFSAATPEVRSIDATQYKGSKTRNVAKDASGQFFTLSHTINNDFLNTTTFDISPITFKVELSHHDDPSYKREITIIQKPAIVVDIYENPYQDLGATYVNNSRSTGQYWNYVSIKLYNEYTANMFIISVSALPQGSQYVIGDPRTMAPSNPNYNSFATTTVVDGSAQRKLTNYYGTRDDNTADNVIAPVIRTASGWGACYDMSYDEAKRRAAAYQEGGYPAGRWRMFTKAEAEFITRLATTNKIPPYFVAGNSYHIAGYSFENGTIKAKVNTAPVRFCYDEWYWSNTDYPKAEPATTFMWGDLPR